MPEIKLSYVITTYNKLPYLKNVMASLLTNVKPDEEIVVTDGGSTDGTVKYLKELFDAHKIHQFISEKDKGESHGWNKAFLLARGELIKVITDDDAFFYPAIQKCKDFMLSHRDIDILASDGVFTKSTAESSFVHSKNYSANYFNVTSDYSHDFNTWKNTGRPFAFCGLGLMLRKSSISLFGLFDPSFVRADAEFALRVTSGKANLSWFTGKTFARIFNPNSNSLTQNDKIKRDTIKLNRIYLDSNLQEEDGERKWYDYLPNDLTKFLRKIKHTFKKQIVEEKYTPNDSDWSNVFKLREEKLAEVNAKDAGEFLYKDIKK